MTYAAGQFVLVTDGGAILSSTNAVDWSRGDSAGYRGYLYSVAWGNGIFLAGGDAGAVLTSSDGVLWTVNDSGLTNAVRGLAFGGGRFVAVGNSTILASADGIIWSPAHTVTGANLCSVAFGHGMFAAVGALGVVLTSTNGLDWASRDLATGNNLCSVTYGQGTFLAVGLAGTILQSGQRPFYPFTLRVVGALPDKTIVLSANGPSESTCTIQTSTNLRDWMLLTEFPNTNSVSRIIDSTAMNYSQRFYRGWAW